MTPSDCLRPCRVSSDVSPGAFSTYLRSARLFTVPFLAILLISSCNSGTDSPPIPRNIEFKPNGLLELVRPDGTLITSIAIEVAQGDSARARGLMDRTSLPEKGGMLFFDDEEREQSFWMKNTFMPLDIIFVSADSQIVSISKRTRPLTEDRVTSDGPAQYVLEVRAGFSDTYGIDETTRLRWRLLGESSGS